MPAPKVNLHASCVAVDGKGVLILGPSGAGKSGLALRLMAFGAQLVADDRTEITVQGSSLIASAPATLFGLIEARGIGILRSEAIASVPLVLAVDLGQQETDRLPPRRSVTISGMALDLVLGSQHDHFPASILCYLKGGRQDDGRA
ncbi:MAG: serine kinase [Rhodobacterales bacterium RIFCSPHIGHO2_02_FULL_62_130]|nr:MAG: serine kinase [Rhodobacterales bacterium RIFCSPHIGHO2_02_FULL_62_130]OHC58345.1 MAG: serine kinase [Rhodobacterales bacterium RIFCSPHIGHO2_12_FULL_62_75]